MVRPLGWLFGNNGGCAPDGGEGRVVWCFDSEMCTLGKNETLGKRDNKNLTGLRLHKEIKFCRSQLCTPKDAERATHQACRVEHPEVQIDKTRGRDNISNPGEL
jgi:hypothetical protein